ncbi:hypothetical protein D3C73_649670 [compost metagenome]
MSITIHPVGDNRLLDLFKFQQCRFNLTKFYTISSNLHLKIETPYKINLSVG